MSAMSDDLPVLLNSLEELTHERHAWRTHADQVLLDYRPQRDRIATIARVAPDDAELIVAAVNAAPVLAAVVRAVLALADELESEVGERDDDFDAGVVSGLFDAAARIRAAVAALDPKEQTDV